MTRLAVGDDLTALTVQRDRAREIAVTLEQENAELRERITDVLTVATFVGHAAIDPTWLIERLSDPEPPAGDA